MTSIWPSSFDQLLNSPAFPMWLTVAAAGFFALIVLATLLRAEKSVANGALTVITLLAVGIAVASMMRSQDQGARGGSDPASTASVSFAPPGLACVDDLAGDLVLSNCEKNLFGSPEMTAAAVSYAAAMLSRLAQAGDLASANKVMTAELLALRRAVERDRYGLMAYVLLTRDRCTPTDCVMFRAVGDRQQLVNNMEGRTYEGLVTRYASQWNAPAAQTAQSAAAGTFAGLAPSAPTGKPTNAEFPSSANTPAVSIMNPEPTASTRSVAPAPAAPKPPTQLAPAPAPPPTVAASHAQAPAAAKKAAPKPKPAAAAPQAAPEAAEPAANNE
ncbi:MULTISPECIES: hypothetical protein [Bradyrhizobium]|jgi:hypothetical protein|uniref:Uncharacterized protein n=3 Tax=Bradyrhizobium TaxID=374 RepID=A0ABS5GJA6_9BRAD|nr:MULTISPECIES: hypothetical protein [Bradyrhizobium]RTM04249.1 MAG: hypothetical protein EKK32_06615 [Bradyrhizobiaceae bacterium]MBR1141403.1 hypothetical protein [Bradyrhizobium denitrificans]MCL8486945.1 hypothetical protein [Bradyrhizobium denitrificans]MDU1496291.1 hypothetical protein [Bradyrhizobium sp.]MDU1546361.1 hypothetical protein [Bradyrhizobium sp.]